MNSQSQYYGHRFPPEIINHTVWLYHRFTLSFRDIDDLLAERGIIVSYETVRQWCLKFGLDYAPTSRKRQGGLGDTWFMDEVFLKINGKRQYLWRAVDQDGAVVDISVQSRRNKQAALRFFRKLLKGQGQSPRKMVTDRLRSYGAARKEVMPSVMHCQDRYTKPDNRNDKREDSNRPDRRSDFSPCTAKLIICLASAAIF